jgi:membrane associated rhomboid family serine protease
MGNLFFWLGIGAAQKGAGSKPVERRHRALSFVVGTLLALLIAVGMLFSVGQPTMKRPQRPVVGLNEQIFGVIEQVRG